MRFLSAALLAATLLLCAVGAPALAEQPDAGAQVTSVPALPPVAAVAPPADVGWPELAGLGLLLVAYAVRRFAPAAHWAHSPGALWGISFAAGAIEAASKAIQMSGFNLRIVLYGVGTWAIAALVMGNPSAPAAEKGPVLR